MNIDKILSENKTKHEKFDALFNPETGEGAPLERFKFSLSDFPVRYYPVAMREIPLITELMKAGSISAFIENTGGDDADRRTVIKKLIDVRIRHDFCYWAFSFVKIKDKEGEENIPFKLNYPQRKTLMELEKMRLSGTPIRMIILKARQWGGSTLVQMYMALVQLVHKKGFYSAIVAHLSSASHKIRAMYSKFIKDYPPELIGIPDSGPLELKPYEKSPADVIISQNGKAVRDNVICIGTMESPYNIRGGHIALAHYSEVGLWKETKGK